MYYSPLSLSLSLSLSLHLVLTLIFRPRNNFSPRRRLLQTNTQLQNVSLSPTLPIILYLQHQLVYLILHTVFQTSNTPPQHVYKVFSVFNKCKCEELLARQYNGEEDSRCDKIEIKCPVSIGKRCKEYQDYYPACRDAAKENVVEEKTRQS
jgi:hypothetical protein